MAGRASDESLKWLDWPQYLAVVEQLRHECGGALHAHLNTRAPCQVSCGQHLRCVPLLSRTCGGLELRIMCCACGPAALDADGKPRPERTVAWSLQRFLIFAILSCVPDRQRTLRELKVGRTLMKEGDTCAH